MHHSQYFLRGYLLLPCRPRDRIEPRLPRFIGPSEVLPQLPLLGQQLVSSAVPNQQRFAIILQRVLFLVFMLVDLTHTLPISVIRERVEYQKIVAAVDVAHTFRQREPRQKRRNRPEHFPCLSHLPELLVLL